MRFHYSSLKRPKAAAKSISQQIEGVTLSSAQNGLAAALGYRDWHELEQCAAESEPSALDQHLPETDAPVRIADFAIRLAETLDLYQCDAALVLARSHLTGDLPLDPWLADAIRDSVHGSRPQPRSEYRGFRMFTGTELMERARPWPRGDRRAEPDRMAGQIPFPPAVKHWLNPLIEEYERTEEVSVLHAYYRERDFGVLMFFRCALVIDGRIVDTEANHVETFKRPEIEWYGEETIAQRSRLPGFRAPQVLARLKKSA
jgi:hypothetical protein